MASSCLFCSIAKGKIPTTLVFESPELIAFRDINPMAPTHILVIPRLHIASLNELGAAESELVGKMLLAAKDIAAAEGISERGYRTVFNCNADAGQTVFHLHLHLLGGRPLDWPPG